MEAAGLHPIGMYNKRRQTTVLERVACCTVYALCTEADWMPGTIRLLQWWDKDTVNEPEE